MTRKKVSRNSPCPCGSGKKYKHCCYDKGFEWQQDDQGTIYKSVPVSDDVKAALEEQRLNFIERFGREPRPDDPIFFDMPPVEQVEFQMVQAMKAAGLDPAFVYAFEKTGLLVTEQNQHLIPEADLDAWDAAVREYDEKHRGDQSRGG